MISNTVTHRACAAAEALRQYDGPTCFAIPGNHDWIDGLETYQRHIQHKGWLGGWLLPQASYLPIYDIHIILKVLGLKRGIPYAGEFLLCAAPATWLVALWPGHSPGGRHRYVPVQVRGGCCAVYRIADDQERCKGVVAVHRYFARIADERMGPDDQAILVTHQPRWLMDWFWERAACHNLRQLVRGHLRGRARVHLSGMLKVKGVALCF